MTLLERWDDYGIWDEKEIRRAIAIAQSVEEFQKELGMTQEQIDESMIMRRADELLEGKR